MGKKIREKLTLFHFAVYCFSIAMVVGTMSFLVYMPDIYGAKNTDAASFAFENEAVKRIEEERKAYAEKIKKVREIQRVVQRELRLKAAFAKKVSFSIYSHTKDLGISLELVVAVMKIESHGRPRVVSSAGAMGLMQVMPFWKKVMNMEDADLFDADTNIKMGVHVLYRYINRYKKIEKALAAYNGSLGSSKYPKKVLKVYEKIIEYNVNEV